MNRPAPPSLRRRLSSTVIGAALLWSIVLAAVLTVAVRRAVDELLDNTLQESAEILYGLISHQGHRTELGRGGALPAPPHDEHLVWQVVDRAGQVIWRSHRAPDAALLSTPSLGLANSVDGWRVFGIALTADGSRQGDMLYVAQVTHVRQAAKWQAVGASAGLTLLVGVLSAWWLQRRVSRELQPLAELSQAVAAFDPLNAAPAPTPAALPATLDELEPMREAVLDLGERLAQRVASERAFAAHAAHALRTPLAGLMAQLAVAEVKSSPEALPHLRRMGTALDQLRSVVTALLTLFRAEQATVRPRTMRVAEFAAHLPFDTPTIDVDVDGQLRADPDLLSAALINLVDNAQKHGAGHVVFSLDATSISTDDWALRVTDDGRGMPDSERQRCQDALDAQRYDQIGGLGLMLADLIARAHGGRLQLQPAAQGFALVLSGRCCAPTPSVREADHATAPGQGSSPRLSGGS